MTQAIVRSKRPEIVPGSRQCRSLAVAVLGVICCGTALGATSPMTACDRTTELENLEVPVSDLSTIVVGHGIADPDDQNDTTIDALPAEGLSEVPILDLAPRVAVILQDVFSAVAVETPSSEASEQPLAIKVSPKSDTPLSPVAGDASQKDPAERVDPDSGIDDVDTVPSIQRQMFRTDI